MLHPAGWEILQMPKAIQTINNFSRSVARRNGKEGILEAYDLDWRGEITGNAVSEGTGWIWEILRF